MDTPTTVLSIFTFLMVSGMILYFLIREPSSDDCVPQTATLDYLVCEECKHLVERKDMQEVMQIYIYTYFPHPYESNSLYFCPEHKKPYNEIEKWSSEKKYFTTRKTEVSEDGTPIGYKKIKK